MLYTQKEYREKAKKKPSLNIINIEPEKEKKPKIEYCIFHDEEFTGEYLIDEKTINFKKGIFKTYDKDLKDKLIEKGLILFYEREVKK
jgi:hypothetical protein